MDNTYKNLIFAKKHTSHELDFMFEIEKFLSNLKTDTKNISDIGIINVQ